MTDGTRRSIGDDRDLGVDRLLQRRRHRVDLVRADSTMPLTPLASAASMSAVCFGEETWPSLSMRLIALLDRLGLEGLHHVDEERES